MCFDTLFQLIDYKLFFFFFFKQVPENNTHFWIKFLTLWSVQQVFREILLSSQQTLTKAQHLQPTN